MPCEELQRRTVIYGSSGIALRRSRGFSSLATRPECKPHEVRNAQVALYPATSGEDYAVPVGTQTLTPALPRSRFIKEPLRTRRDRPWIQGQNVVMPGKMPMRVPTLSLKAKRRHRRRRIETLRLGRRSRHTPPGPNNTPPKGGGESSKKVKA